ncbi:hypothetical protein EMPG_10778 [Blastomyces silverae]|uniref:Uncharacterized protein n=1 Tax=Blastomyces silverae TaxID=2060906 RepID=A0A0H1B443_9EURO|nr:hypothetical protein EMPG_10778 [Blastomyces silverae]
MALQRGLRRPGPGGVVEQACGHYRSSLRTVKRAGVPEPDEWWCYIFFHQAAASLAFDKPQSALKGALVRSAQSREKKRKPTKTMVKAPLWSNKQAEIVELAEITSKCVGGVRRMGSVFPLVPGARHQTAASSPSPLGYIYFAIPFSPFRHKPELKVPWMGKQMSTGSLSCSTFPLGPLTPLLDPLHQNKIGKWMRTCRWSSIDVHLPSLPRTQQQTTRAALDSAAGGSPALQDSWGPCLRSHGSQLRM